MTSSPRVTVVTAVYNGMPHLRAAIESTLSQTMEDFEYIIIDDGSTDESVACIQSYTDPRIRFIRNEKNLGTSGTMNKGIELARAPLIARLDQDDVSLPDRIARQCDAIQLDGSRTAVCSWEYGIDAAGRRVRNWRGVVENDGGFLGPLLLALCPIWHPSILFRREILLQIGGYKKEYQPVEDFEVTMRLALTGHHVSVVQEYLVEQRHHGHRQSVTKLEAQMKNRIRVHDEMLRRLFHGSEERRAALGALLRLDDDVWQRCFTKDLLLTARADVESVVDETRRQFHLSAAAHATMERIVWNRLGVGVRLAPLFRSFPEWLFFIVVWCCSPFSLPRVRAVGSAVYELLHELRYPFRLFTGGLERRG